MRRTVNYAISQIAIDILLLSSNVYNESIKQQVITIPFSLVKWYLWGYLYRSQLHLFSLLPFAITLTDDHNFFSFRLNTHTVEMKKAIYFMVSYHPQCLFFVVVVCMSFCGAYLALPAQT